MTLRSLLATEPRCGCPATVRLWFQSLTHRRAVVGTLLECRRCKACWVWGRA